jgi:hypothetical protein
MRAERGAIASLLPATIDDASAHARVAGGRARRGDGWF